MRRGSEAEPKRRLRDFLKGGDSAPDPDPASVLGAARDSFIKAANETVYDSTGLRIGFNRVIDAARQVSLPPEDIFKILRRDAELGISSASLNDRPLDADHFEAFRAAFYVAEQIVSSPKPRAQGKSTH